MNVQQGARDELIAAARSAQRRAYAPYSRFAVGAAVLTSGGEIFVGCNVENASYGLTICAERAAVAAAVAGGSCQLELLAVATSGAAPPCGACRQVLAEFNPQLPILLVDASRNNAVVEVSLAELFPQGFHLPREE